MILLTIPSVFFLPYEVVTKHQDHAKKYVMESLDLEAYDGIVTCGGDGIFSEVINVGRPLCMMRRYMLHFV